LLNRDLIILSGSSSDIAKWGNADDLWMDVEQGTFKGMTISW